MRGAAISLLLLFLFCGHVALASEPLYSASAVGTISGVQVTLIYDFNGSNGGASSLEAYYANFGGNGPQTHHVHIAFNDGTSIEGDRMGAFFAGDGLYVTGSHYGPMEAHCCSTHTLVREYKIRDGALAQVGTDKVIANPSRPDYSTFHGTNLKDWLPEKQYEAEFHNSIINAF